MDKERSEWVKKYMLEKGCTKQSAYEAYAKSQAKSKAFAESQVTLERAAKYPSSRERKQIESETDFTKREDVERWASMLSLHGPKVNVEGRFNLEDGRSILLVRRESRV